MKVCWDKFKTFINLKSLSIQYIDLDNQYWMKGFDGNFDLECFISKGSSDAIDFETNYKANGNKSPTINTPPFAEPIYRTKYNATPDITIVNPGESANSDFQITEECYVYGGEGSVKNAQFGDYFTAEIVDKDSLIPEPYRAAICENWPTVARYVNKMWVIHGGSSTADDFTEMGINTYPLIAKLPIGMYLRATYYATNAGDPRQVVFNYYITRKL